VLKRVFLFVLTNIAVMAMVSIVLAILGQLGLLDLAGGQGVLLVYCAVWSRSPPACCAPWSGRRSRACSPTS
jgi:hypothetical protein